jgi:hypothetical protein
MARMAMWLTHDPQANALTLSGTAIAKALAQLLNVYTR